MKKRPDPFFLILVLCCSSGWAQQLQPHLRAELDPSGTEVRIFADSEQMPILTQVARADFRPYIHPIVAPDGQGVLSEFSPAHHPHQTGLFWGFTRLNGRDYFHHPDGAYWRRVALRIVTAEAASPVDSVSWQTVYDLLAEDGSVVLQESQLWSLSSRNGTSFLDLEWTGDAKTDVTVSEYDYGGLFLRMPWRPDTVGQVNNSARQTNDRAEGQRAVWVDVGMNISGRSDQAHVAIFDHPQNSGYPLPWRVDDQMGVGPVRSRLGDWRIEPGQPEKIRHRLVIYTGSFSDVQLNKQWSEFSGQEMAYAEWNQAQQEGFQAEFLSPEQAAQAMTLQDGFLINVFAAEPMMTQPMAFCWDSRGRLWIAENRDYESRGSGFSNSGDSRILILEDTDHDGVADRRTVFAEGIPFPAAIAVGMGGLWLGTPPNLMLIPDRNQDDRGDMDQIEIRLTGWGISDRHETLNSFLWGPDGWLYGCQGFATTSRVGKPAGNGKLYRPHDAFPTDVQIEGQPVEINGGVWRYHPVKDRFEVVAHGFSNPWGIDYDAHGQLFITACVIPHLWHVIPGGIYQRQGGSHFSQYVYRDIQTIADHGHRSAHGGARIYLSDAFPPQYQGRIFMANIHEHAVLTDILQRAGSGFVGHHGDDFALANNAQWIGFSVEIGPDGAVYVLDWHDADICGKEVLNKDTGRVFRFAPGHSAATDFENRYADLETLSDRQLVALQRVSSVWHARRARLILQYRATQKKLDPHAIEDLKQMFSAPSGSAAARLQAFWTLCTTGLFIQRDQLAALADAEEYVRAWAIQFLCEDFHPPAEALTRFVEMARSDPSPVVRLYLASAVQRISDFDTWPILDALAAHAEDADDHNLPCMIWFGLEPLVPGDPARALQLAGSTGIPLLARHIAHRLADADQLAGLVQGIATARNNQIQLLLGMRDGLEGRYDVNAPASWPETYAALRTTGGDVSRIALELSQQFGDTVAAKTMLATLQDATAGTEDRLTALRGLVGRKREEVKPELVKLLNEESSRREAIRAMAAFDDETLADILLEKYASFSEEDKLETVQTLASRSGSGRKLTQAIKTGLVPRRDVPAFIARLLQRVVGNGFVEVWGPIEELSSDKEAQFAKLRRLLTPAAIGAADPANGRLLFNRTCASCHKLFGYGSAIGPDITGANRSEVEYLLGNILTPSADIQDAYKMSIVLMDDGRTYSGILAEENERVIKLRVANQAEPVTLAQSEIESRKIADVSMMPDGILDNLTNAEILDLMSYLKSPRQVDLPR